MPFNQAKERPAFPPCFRTWHQELLVKVVDGELGIVSAARLLVHAVPGDADGAGELHPHAIDGSR